MTHPAVTNSSRWDSSIPLFFSCHGDKGNRGSRTNWCKNTPVGNTYKQLPSTTANPKKPRFFFRRPHDGGTFVNIRFSLTCAFCPLPSALDYYCQPKKPHFFFRPSHDARRFVNVRFSLRFVMVSVSDPLPDDNEDEEDGGDSADSPDVTTLSYALADVDIM